MTDDPKAQSRIDPELLAAYVDNRLPPEQRAEVEARLAADSDSYELLVEMINTQDALESSVPKVPRVPGVPTVLVPKVPKVPKVRQVRWAIAGGVLAAAAAVVLVVQLQPELLDRLLGRDSVDPRFEKLVAAVGEERYVEARLSGGFKFGPMRAVTRGPGDLSQQNLELLAAAGELQKAAATSPTPENLHAWGVAQLLLGQDDEAVADIGAAIAGRPENGSMHADLAVALLTRFARQNRADDLPQALEAASRAVDLEPNSLEALFAKASALQGLHLDGRAREAWRAYLLLDSTSGWAGEARRRLEELDRTSPQSRFGEWRRELLQSAPSDTVVDGFVAGFTDEVVDFLIADLLGNWSNAVLSAAAAGGATDLSTASRLAKAFGDRTNDRTFERLVAEFTGPTSRLTRDGVLGVSKLAAAVHALAEDRYVDAEPLFREAGRLLDDECAVLAAWSGYGQARLRFVRGQLPDAADMMAEVSRKARRLDHLALDARASWIRGIVRFSQARWSDSRSDYLAALSIFDAQRNAQGAAAVHLNLSILYRFLGERVASWQHRMMALENAPTFRPARYHSFLVSAGASASLDGFNSTALTFIDESVTNAADLGPHHREEAHLQRARLNSRLGRGELASEDLLAAQHEWTQIPDAAVKSLQEMAIKTAAAQISQRERPAVAVDAAREGLAIAARRQDSLRSAELHLYLSRALAALGRRDEALSAVDEGIAQFERARSSMRADEAARLSSFEPVWDLFDALAALHAGPGDVDLERAFAALERGRARTLAEARQFTPRTLESVQGSLDSRTTLVVLRQLDDELLAFYIGHQTSRIIRSPFSRAEADRLVTRFQHALRHETHAETGAEIVKRLLGPVLETDGEGTIIVVPDDPYRAVAWAALPDATGAPLIVRRAILVAPSASWVGADEPASRRSPSSALVIGGPKTEGVGAAPLTGARREVVAIARLYEQAETRTGPEATPGALVGLAPAFDVIHVAAHAVESPYPLLSHLLLASGPQEDGVLTVQDLLRARPLRAHAIVVLAACASIGSGSRRGEGSIGLAWAYLRLGARSVIGTMWEIDDAKSEELFVELHRHLREGTPPAQALRLAQIHARSRGVPSSEWGAVQLVGQP